MDDLISLSNRLLNRCPSVGILLSQQFINDSWHTLQARREWSFRRRSGIFTPPALYNTGTASTNVANGAPTQITGSGTTWTAQMIGSQIRIGGLLYPFYTIVGWLSATSILIDQPWSGPDVSNQSFDILQSLYPVPADFGWLYTAVSVKDGFKLNTRLTQSELAILDPQRATYGQTYAAVFRDYTPMYGGTVGPVIPVTSPIDGAPVSTTTTGYSYVANATYIVQVVGGGIAGVATYQWMRAGQSAFQPVATTSDLPVDLSDGVQIYWPDGVTYIANDLFVINCASQIASGVPRIELWPPPTSAAYLYPFIYIAKESDLTPAQPSLPPFIANRGEVLLEMALEKCAEFPGSDDAHLNIYHDLRQAKYHRDKVTDMLIDMERNDEEVSLTQLGYQSVDELAAPWMDGAWQQRHAPGLMG